MRVNPTASSAPLAGTAPRHPTCALPGPRLALLAVAAGLLFAAPLLAQDPAADALHAESDVMVLEVLVDGQRVSDGISAWQSGKHLLLPLGELAGLLTLAIRTQPDQGTASGFILEEERSFSLDVARLAVVRGGVGEALDPRQVQVLPDDIYVSSALLARWLPVDLDVDMSRLSVRVRPRERLPLQFRLDREAAGARAGTRSSNTDPGYPRHDIPYRWLGIPTLDQTLSADFRGGNGRRHIDGRYTAYATGDLLRMQGALYINAGTGGEPADVRLTLGRHDPDAGLLGPMRARTALLGNVAMPAVANITRSSAQGDGFLVSNRPLALPDSFGQHSLQGPLLPGWDVELYFNDTLVGFQVAGPDGQYHFDDLTLLFGPNEFRLVFHGPLGEVRVERETFLLEQSLTRPGEFFYSVGQQRDEEGRSRSAVQVDWGLAEHLGVTGGLVRTPLAGAMQNYANLGLRAYWGSMIVSGEIAKAQGGGSLVEATLRTRLGNWTINASQSRLDDFASEWFPASDDPVRTHTRLRADGYLSLPASTRRLPVTLEANRETRESGASTVDAAARLSAHMGGVSTTAQLRWRSSGAQEQADATVQMSRRVGSLSIRGQLDYALMPESRLTALTVAADKRLGQGYLQSFGITRLFDTGETLYSTGLTKSMGSFGLGINAGFASSGDITAGARLFVAMGRARGGAWNLSALPMANSGSVSALVFLDENMNSLMDAGEQPIPGVAFAINGGRHPTVTGSDGIAYLERVPALRHADVSMLPGTLEDPQWLPRRTGMRVLPRPGAAAELEFPVIVTSEVDGTVYLSEGGASRGLADIMLEVVAPAGDVIATTISGPDGYYVLTGIPTGEYGLRVSPPQMQRLGLIDDAQHPLVVSADGWLVSGMDIELRRP